MAEKDQQAQLQGQGGDLERWGEFALYSEKQYPETTASISLPTSSSLVPVVSNTNSVTFLFIYF